MAGRNALSGTGAAVEFDRLFGAAVDRVHELQLPHSVVVFGFHLGENFLYCGRLDIPAGLDEGDVGRLVRQHIDQEVRRARDHSTVEALEDDLVHPLALHPKRAPQRAIFSQRERYGIALLDDDRPARHRESGRHAQANLRALERRDIPAVLLDARRQASVSREMVLELELLDVREVGHLDVEDRGSDSARLHHVLRILIQVEEEKEVVSCLVIQVHRPAFPLHLLTASNRDRYPRCIEIVQPRRHLQIGAPCDSRVSREHGDAVRALRRRPTEREEQEGAAGAQERRSEEYHRERGQRSTRKKTGGTGE